MGHVRIMSRNLNFTVSLARPDDAPDLTRIAHAAKSYWGYPDEWMAAWHAQLTVDPQDIVADPTFVACADDRIVGFCAVSQRGDIASLEHLWVLPDAMGCGVGRALFDQAALHAGRSGATLVEVEADPHAVDFYRHLGCQPFGETVYELDGQPRRLPLLRLSLPQGPVDRS